MNYEKQYEQFRDYAYSGSKYFYGDKEHVSNVMERNEVRGIHSIIALAIIYKNHPTEDVVIDYG